MPQYLQAQTDETHTVSPTISAEQTTKTLALEPGEFLLSGEWAIYLGKEKKSPEVEFLRDRGFRQELGRANLPSYEYDRRLTINDVKRAAQQVLTNPKVTGKQVRFTIESLHETIDRIFRKMEVSDTHKKLLGLTEITFDNAEKWQVPAWEVALKERASSLPKAFPLTHGLLYPGKQYDEDKDVFFGWNIAPARMTVSALITAPAAIASGALGAPFAYATNWESVAVAALVAPVVTYTATHAAFKLFAPRALKEYISWGDFGVMAGTLVATCALVTGFAIPQRNAILSDWMKDNNVRIQTINKVETVFERKGKELQEIADMAQKTGHPDAAQYQDRAKKFNDNKVLSTEDIRKFHSDKFELLGNKDDTGIVNVRVGSPYQAFPLTRDGFISKEAVETAKRSRLDEQRRLTEEIKRLGGTPPEMKFKENNQESSSLHTPLVPRRTAQLGRSVSFTVAVHPTAVSGSASRMVL